MSILYTFMHVAFEHGVYVSLRKNLHLSFNFIPEVTSKIFLKTLMVIVFGKCT